MIQIELPDFKKVQSYELPDFTEYIGKSSNAKIFINEDLKSIFKSFFQIKINGIKGVVSYRDMEYYDYSNKDFFKNAVFACHVQVRKEDLKKHFYNFRKYGIRTYPIPFYVKNHFGSQIDLFLKAISLLKSSDRKDKKYLSHICFGIKHRLHRQEWIDFANKNSLFHTEWIGGERYFEVLNNSKWGIILKGHGVNGKCFRETEYIGLRMPLACNYKPFYTFPFTDGKEYVLLKQPEDMLALKDVNMAPFIKRSKELWGEYFSPNGIAKLVNDFAFDKNYKIMESVA